MANAHTFEMRPVKELLGRYIQPATVVVDPFARDSQWAQFSNDEDPETTANFHLDYEAFLLMLVAQEVRVDMVLLDPPYSPRQISEHYNRIKKRKAKMEDTQIARMRARAKDLLSCLLKPEGVAINFGWNSVGFGKKRGFAIEEIMLVAHGAGHNDTIVTVERKL